MKTQHYYENIKIKTINIVKFTSPLLLSSVMQLLFGIGDQAIIGRTSVDNMAAVGVATSFLYYFTGTLGVLGVVFNIKGAEYLGKKDYQRFEAYFNLALTLAIIIGLAFEVVCLIFGKYILSQFYGLTSPVLDIANQYLRIAGLGLGANCLIFLGSAFYKNIQQTKTLLYASILAGIVNLLIDYILVFGKFGAPKLGVSGAAIGTVVGLFVCLTWYLIGISRFKNMKIKFGINIPILSEFMKKFFWLSGQDLMEYTIFALAISAMISRLNTFDLASYNLLNSIIEIILLPMYALSSATLTFVARAKGENNSKEVQLYPIICVGLSLLVLIFFGTILASRPQLFCSIITNKTALIINASKYVCFLLLIQSFNILNNMYKNSLLAIGFEKWVLMYSFIISLLGLTVVYLLTFYLNLDLYGIYIGLGIYYLLLSIGYLTKFLLLSG